MNKLKNITFKIAQDGSTGLYDKTAGDILHSAEGALKEAHEKFINPVLEAQAEIPEKLNILDICYGIGYNTKATLTAFKNRELKIDALELNKDLILLSPFIKDAVENDALKIFLISSIFKQNIKSTEIQALFEFLADKENAPFISAFTMRFKGLIKEYGIESINELFQGGLLHNIYYRYISCSMKNAKKPDNYCSCILNFFTEDARSSIKHLNKKYDIIFLDGYSPKKNPCLWTIDFLSEIKNIMKDNAVLVSYSKSSPYRSALLELGFFCGKTVINSSEAGTIAALDNKLIKNELSKYDMDILKTRSGIPYRDNSALSLSADEILRARDAEMASSSKISRTQFDKMHPKTV